MNKNIIIKIPVIIINQIIIQTNIIIINLHITKIKKIFITKIMVIIKVIRTKLTLKLVVGFKIQIKQSKRIFLLRDRLI